MWFRKRPIKVQAKRLTKTNVDEIMAWAGEVAWKYVPTTGDVLIMTLEGTMVARIGDWIVKGAKGEFYPVRDDIFRDTYDKVPEDNDAL